MRVLLPPVLVALLLLAVAALGWTERPLGGVPFPEDRPTLLALAIALAGVALLGGARAQFARNGCEIMTFATPRNLVTTGLFRLSRNPMYLGFVLVLLGAALAANVWAALLAPLVFLLTAQLWYILAEEIAAREAFGADYDAYAERTRRWL